MSGPNGLDIIFVINKSDTSDLKKDGEILEEGIKLQSKICGVAINSIKWMDQRETPLPCDICIHFEIPFCENDDVAQKNKPFFGFLEFIFFTVI